MVRQNYVLPTVHSQRLQTRDGIVKQLPRIGIQIASPDMAGQPPRLACFQVRPLTERAFEYRKHALPPFVGRFRWRVWLRMVMPRKPSLHVRANLLDGGSSLRQFAPQDF